jgi:hypothetical protein
LEDGIPLSLLGRKGIGDGGKFASIAPIIVPPKTSIFAICLDFVSEIFDKQILVNKLKL